MSNGMRWTEDQLAVVLKARPGSPVRSGDTTPPKNKHRARSVVVDGIRFGSKLEYARWQALQLLQAAGAISDLRAHREWPLIVQGFHIATYIDDASYLQDGLRVIEDSKGQILPEYVIKAKLFNVLYAPLKITEVKSTRRSSR